MSRLPWFLLILMTSVLAPACGRAADGSAAYLRDGVGARWSGMGGAAIAASDDVHAVFSNPAGLSRLGTVVWQVGSLYAFQDLERSTSSLSVAHQTDSFGTLALSWVHRSVGGLEFVDDGGFATGVTSSAEDAVVLSGAHAVLYQLRAGASLKLLRQSMFGAVGSGFGLDLGVQFQPVLAEDLWLGVSLENLAGSVAWDGGSTDAPAHGFGGGVAWRTLRRLVLLSLDVVSRDGFAGTQLRAGAEIRPIPFAALRFGWDGLRPSVGASYLWKPYQFDYGFAYDPSGFSSRHLLSFLLHF